ncbi:hypothetical protein BDA96_02G018900 [Sorghum bicolor]|uniref:Uncharacterized protein n=1 Tax=Sorghum bicolor TaxID=4558 RepID=A0A921RJI6_SORBI|nr:hypothetical protein BDA96_02G018900 [Sorghum bicolor]
MRCGPDQSHIGILATGSLQSVGIRLPTGSPQPMGVKLVRPPRPRLATNSRSAMLSRSATNIGSTFYRGGQTHQCTHQGLAKDTKTCARMLFRSYNPKKILVLPSKRKRYMWPPKKWPPLVKIEVMRQRMWSL